MIFNRKLNCFLAKFLQKFKKIVEFFLKNWKSSSREECRICRSRKMLKNASSLAIGGFDTEENEPI